MFAITMPKNKSNFRSRDLRDGVQYVLRFLWNDRVSRWFVSVFDLEENELYGATKIVSNFPLTTLTKSEDIFPGEIWSIDSTGIPSDPSLRQLDNGVLFMYYEDGD